VDALGIDGNASMPEHVNRPNPWRKMVMMMTVPVFTDAVDLTSGDEFKVRHPVVL
jgi:hypothetical protein